MDVDTLQKMTVAELREEAKKLGDVKGIASMKKDDLIRLIADAGTTVSYATRRKKSIGLDLGALKQKVRELKARRIEAAAKSQKAKVGEINSDLRPLRRRLRRAARRRRKSS